MAKILIVDDDAALREVVRVALESAGYEVIEAEDGEKGVELAGEQLPDLILCDVRMEKMDGYGTLAALRRNSVTASLPFILMTGQSGLEGMRQGMELGADDYLPKPFSVDALMAAVEARLRKQEAVREQASRQLATLRANISLSLPHELLTPLNGILGFADIMATDAEALEAAEVASMAGAVRDSAQRLHRLIQNFLLLAHLELHQHDSAVLVQGKRRVNLGRLVEVLARGGAARAERSSDLVVEVEDLEAVVREDYWSKIVEEMIDNALKFSRVGSPIRVELKRRGVQAILRVTDRGRGMHAEHLAAVGAYMQFERKFYEQQGSGLGLTIAKRLAELHGGRVALSSEVGVGTEVEVSVPAVAVS